MADHGDPIVKALQKSSIAQTLKAARASLAEPSRPYTPHDRSLFQRPNEGSEPRPSSSYGVDQVTFVRDTFGSRPGSASSKSRPDPIQEEGVDILRLDQEEAESSDSEELTPVVATPPPAARATSGPLSASPVVGPPKPPRPPGGYPGSGSRSSLGGYPDSEKSPKRLSSSSPRRRLASLTDTAPGTPGSGRSGSRSGTRRRNGSASPAGRLAAAAEELGSVPAAHAPCEVVISRLQSMKASKDMRLNKDDFAQLCDRILVLATDMKAGKAATGSLDSAAQLLREIMGLMELKDLKESKYLFKLARCAFALLSIDAATAGVPISGVQAAYQNIAQVLFKYSQKEGNDAEFLSAKLIEPLIEVLESSSDSCSSTDLRVYIAGILKNVSNDSANQKLLAQRGAVTALFKLMDRKVLTGNPKEVPWLIQVTASLRNFASNQYKQFLIEDHLNALTNVMATYIGHVELLTNVARILSKLTLHDKAVEALAKSDVHLRQMVQTLRGNVDSGALCLRLLFVLGNLTERSARLRMVFAFDCEGTALVPELLGKYWQKERQNVADRRGSAGERSEYEEVLVKLVRLLANVAISESAGETLAASSAVSEPLLDMLGAKKITESEELVLNVVAAITNLLFYDVPANLLFQEETKQLLCRLFRPLLLESYNVEALVETARALGNLSRHADARQCMASLRLDEILVILLDHDDRDLVFYACGALVNLAADAECIPRLTGATPAVQKLAKLLGDAPCNDAVLQLVAVKVLTNLSLDARAAWPMEDVETVRGVLAQTIADSQEQGPEEGKERQQLIDLAKHLQGRLPAAEATGAGDGTAAAAWFYCSTTGCGRRFGSEEKLKAHVQRRHAAEVLE